MPGRKRLLLKTTTTATFLYISPGWSRLMFPPPAFQGASLMLTRWAVAPVVLCCCAALAPSADDQDFKPHKFDWPQWQGPARNDLSQETGLLKTWPKEGPKLLWKAKDLGAGFVTPSIAAGRVFSMGNIDTAEYVTCRSEKDGGELWKAEVGPVRSEGSGYPGPRCTPTVAGNLLYALGLNGDLVCLTVADGKEQWRKDLVKEFGGHPGGWGYSESPLVDGDKVLVTPGGKKASIVAFDKLKGSLVWTAVAAGNKQVDTAAYSSIIAADVHGQRQYIQFMSRGMVGFEADTGKYLWRYNKPANGTANISTPVYHDNFAFASSSYSTGGGLVKLTRDGGKADASEVYFTDKMQNHHGGMVLLDGYLYGETNGHLACLKFLTGDIVWESNAPGKGSITYADSRLYYRNENGKIYLIEANPAKYVQDGVFSQPERSKRPAWAHPVVANGRLYIADQDVLLCYDVKQK
jgi:outer membrane protein assembly factor BamB